MDFDTWYKAHPAYFEHPSDGLVDCVARFSIAPGLALDLGCGQGRNAVWLASRGFKVTAIDKSAQAIEFLIGLAAKYHFSIDTRVQDITTCELNKGAYDLVVVQTTLNHLNPPEAIPECCQKIIQALTYGGILYCVGFTTEDPGFSKGDNRSECSGFCTYYFSCRELMSYFAELDCLFYDEYSKIDDSHGPPHKHGKVKLIARRKPTNLGDFELGLQIPR